MADRCFSTCVLLARIYCHPPLWKCCLEIMDIKDEIPRLPQCYGITILCPWIRDDDESARAIVSGASAHQKVRRTAVTVIEYFSRVYSGSAPCDTRVFFTSILGIGAKWVKNLDVTFECNLKFDMQINSAFKACFYQLWAWIKACLLPTNLERVTHAFISSRLDYCNALYGRHALASSLATKSVTMTISTQSSFPTGSPSVLEFIVCF